MLNQKIEPESKNTSENKEEITEQEAADMKELAGIICTILIKELEKS